MDTLLASRRAHWRATDWTAAAVSGFAAGATLMVLDLIWSSIVHPGGPWRISYMLAPILTGAEPVRTGFYGFSFTVVATALVIHYILGIVFGLVTGVVMAQLGLDASPRRALAAGVVLGTGVYLINFEILVGLFPWLADLRGLDTYCAHVVFGMVAALLYWKLKRTEAVH